MFILTKRDNEQWQPFSAIVSGNRMENVPGGRRKYCLSKIKVDLCLKWQYIDHRVSKM